MSDKEILVTADEEIYLVTDELAGERLKLFRVWGALDDSSRAQLKRVFSLIVGRKKQEKKKREIIIHEKRK